MSDIKKVQKKLRASEAARVKAVRRAEASEFNFGQNVKELRTAESEIKKLKKDRASLKLWTEEHCTCGGDGQHNGCRACQAYHAANLGGGE